MYNIGVIYGSRTCEHDVSIISALQAAQALDKKKYNVTYIYIGRAKAHGIRAKRSPTSNFMSTLTRKRSRACFPPAKTANWCSIICRKRRSSLAA